MIKSFFHIVFAIIFSLIFSAIVTAIFYFSFLRFYHINILSPETYHFFAEFWNSGGVLKTNDIIMIFLLFTFIPINLFAWRNIYRAKYLDLITKPLTWLMNLDIKNYKVPNINIKNLKVEEKKSLEQFVQERVEKENKKAQRLDATQFRRDIIERIENNKNK